MNQDQSNQDLGHESTTPPPSPPPPPVHPGALHAVAVPSPTIGLSVAALVLGIISLIPCITSLLGILALILGIIATVLASKDPARYGGRGMAIAGIVTGAVGLLLFAVIFFGGLLLPSLSRARDAARTAQCMAQLNQIGKGLDTYFQNNATLPGAGDDWARLITDGQLVIPEIFVCPDAGLGVTTHYFMVPQADGKWPAANEVLLYEHPDNHGTSGGNVLYGDLSARKLGAFEFQEIINNLTLPDGTRWAPHEN